MPELPEMLNPMVVVLLIIILGMQKSVSCRLVSG